MDTEQRIKMINRTTANYHPAVDHEVSRYYKLEGESSQAARQEGIRATVMKDLRAATTVDEIKPIIEYLIENARFS